MTEITLQQLLESRDDRAQYQRELLAGYNLPLVSFTVNMPGTVKQNRESRIIFSAGVYAIREKLAGHVMSVKTREKPTGYEAFFAVEMPPLQIKEKMCRLEEEHPLGRLFDIDVLQLDGSQIGRQQLQLPPRKCLLCDGDGAACARSRAHSIEQLLDRIRQMVQDWTAQQSK